MNAYLQKKIEVHHILRGNCDILMEIVHQLNLSNDELSIYKERMNKIKDLFDSLPRAKCIGNSQAIICPPIQRKPF
jgi:hypothetical protein